MYEFLASKKRKVLFTGLILFVYAIFIYSLCVEPIKPTIKNVLFLLLWYGLTGAFLFCSLLRSLADIKFDKTHVYIRYPLGKWKKYSWDDFQEVGLYFESLQQSQRRPYEPSLYFIRKGVKKRRVMGGWPLNNMFKFRKVIGFGFSEEIWAAVKDCCPFPVYVTPVAKNKKTL